MDDITRFVTNEKELETLIEASRIFNEYIGMKFGIENCDMQVIIIGKRHMMERVGLPNQDKNKTLGEKETYKNVRVSEADTIKQAEMNEKIKSEYSRGQVLEIKPHSRNLVKGINTWALSFVRYSVPFLSRMREDLL